MTLRTLTAGLLIGLSSVSLAFGAETIKPAFNEAIPNIPGKRIEAVVVTYAPGAKSLPHTHAHSAFITAYVLSGAVRSQVNGGEIRIFHAGQSWTEAPGAHHNVSENASATESASLLAIFVVDANDKNLTVPDKKDSSK